MMTDNQNRLHDIYNLLNKTSVLDKPTVFFSELPNEDVLLIAKLAINGILTSFASISGDNKNKKNYALKLSDRRISYFIDINELQTKSLKNILSNLLFSKTETDDTKHIDELVDKKLINSKKLIYLSQLDNANAKKLIDVMHKNKTSFKNLIAQYDLNELAQTPLSEEKTAIVNKRISDATLTYKREFYFDKHVYDVIS